MFFATLWQLTLAMTERCVDVYVNVANSGWQLAIIPSGLKPVAEHTVPPLCWFLFDSNI